MSDDLLQRFLADRDALTADELAALVGHLRAVPAAAAEARALLQLDDLLSRTHAGDRGHFAQRVATRLATATSSSFVARTRAPLRLRRRRATAARWSWALAASLAAVLLLATGLALGRRDEARPPAVAQAPTQVPAPQAPPRLTASGRATCAGQAVGSGLGVRAGDEVLVSDGTATLAWPDGSRLELAAGARLRLTAVAPKQVRLEDGSVLADVVRQPAGGLMTLGTRDAESTVLGTRFRVTVGRATRLDVEAGTVRFAGAGGAVEVAAGEMASCGAGQPPRKQARQLSIAFGRPGVGLPAGTLVDRGEVFEAQRGYGWERPNDGSSWPGVDWKLEGRPHNADRKPVPPVPDRDPLRTSGLAVGWAGHAEAWRLAVADGTYEVTVGVGGTTVQQGPHRVVVQGTVAVADVLTAAGAWHETTVRVVVSDGWLRLAVGGTTAPPDADGSSDTILGYLRLTALSADR